MEARRKLNGLGLPRQWKVITSTLLLLFTFAIGNAMADEIFSWTATSALAKNASEDATGGTVTCTGSGFGSESPSGSGFYKFNSSTQLTCTLSSGTFAAGDVITFTFTSAGNNKTVGVEIQETSPVTSLTETIVTKGTSVSKIYTVTASDGIQGQNKFSIKRVDSNFSLGGVSVTRSSGGGDPVCPSGLTISSKDSKVAFNEGDAIELTASLSAGNGAITYQWYKGSVAPANAISGATKAKYEVASCTTANAGNYFCVASKTSCPDAVNASAFAITVAADTKCFNMPAITSKPADLASVTVTGGTLSDVSTAKAVAMNANGLKLDGNSVYLKVTLADASIVEDTKITVAWKGAGSGAGIAVVNGDLAEKVIDETGVEAAGSVTHTFTAAEAANYADEFIIHRNASGTGIYVNAITVEDCGPAVTKHTVTLNYNDGETPNGSLTVVDGNAAVKPADPTRGKYTFLGWFVGETDDEYVWSTAVTDDIILKAHWQDPWTLTFNADGGSEVADITVKHNTKAEKPADPTKDDYDFMGWFYGSPAVAFDWDANVTQNYALVAHWQPAVAKYDVEYYDGETKIGTEEQVWATAHPTAAGIETAKPLYTFVGWYLTSALEGDPVALNTVTPVEGLKLYGKWTKAYATSYDMEAYAVSDGATLETLLSNLDAAGYAYTNVNGIDNGHTHNYIYDGMKYKTNDGDLSFNVNAGKLVIVKTGNLPANALTMYINGVADPTIFVGANEAVETHVNNYFYSAVEALYRLDIQASKGTCAIKAVTITDPFTVSFEAHGDADPADMQGTPSVTLPTPTNGSASFLGWFDAETGGNKIGEAGASYTPTANISLHAQWEAISTDARLASITFSSDAGTLSPAFDPEVTSYTYTMPYVTAAVPTITAATSVSAKAQEPQIVSQASAWGETAVIRGVAESSDTKAYNITMLRAPKDGVCLVWGDITADNTITYNATNSKFYAESDVTLDTDVNGKDSGAPSGKKFQGGDHIQIGLNEGTFLAGDVVALNVTYGTANKMYVFKAQAATAEDVIGELDGTTTPAGVNKVAITENAANLWLVRGGIADSWNPHVDYVAVYRAMNPILKAITINSRAGEIDALNDHHFSVLIPYDADLAALTIVPTIVRNAPHATTPEAVISNEGDWIEGDNTYRVMDKDGDYTDYTITLTRDVLKHTVSFNTHGGSTIDPVEVAHGEYLLAAPADPTKDENVFKFWSETEDGAEVDITTVQINADKEFHAVWEAEPAGIKLFDGEGNLNTVNFVSPDKTTIEIDEVEHVCLAQFSSNRTSLGGATQADMVQYNATTDEAKMKITFYNTNSGVKKAILYKLEEGGEPTKIEIEVPGQTIYTTDYYEFNSSKNRSFYVCMNDRSNIRVLQVKVIDNGSAIRQAGQAGYSATFNKGRMYVKSGTPATFEGMTLNASSEYKVYNNSNIATTSYIQFNNAVAGTILKVTRSGGKYYVSQNPEEKGTIYNANAEVELTATGTWYLGSETSGSAATFSKIEFIAPKCEEPAFNSLANSDLCEGAAFEALNGTATVGDAGTPIYQWYKADGDVAIEGATNATYTPNADGSYYVIATNQLAGYSDNSKKSDIVTVTHFASAVITTAPLNQRATVGNDVRLSVAATGKNVAYKWYTCDEDGSNEAALDPEQTGTSIEVTITAGLLQWYKVKVTSDCGNVEAMAKVEEFVPATPANVTESIVWDWKSTTAGFPTENTSIDFANTSVEELFADVDAAMPNNAEFRSDMLYGIGQYAWRNKSDGEWGFQGFQIRFYTEVAGRVRVYFRAPSSGQTSVVTINGRQAGSRGNSWGWSEYVDVEANTNVIIAMTNGETGMTRVQKIEFQTPSYVRTEMLGAGVYGTICVDHNVPEGGVRGVTVYEIAGREPQYGKIAFDEVTEMVAGVPYVFIAHGNEMALYYGETTVANPVNGNGMYGTFVAQTLTELDGIYYFAKSALWSCVDLTSLNLPANRAYVKLSEIDYLGSSSPAPGRKRLLIGVNGAPAVATGLENGELNEAPRKVLINGELFILRGEKMYDAKGQLVK